jgi:hypothetical protein
MTCRHFSRLWCWHALASAASADTLTWGPGGSGGSGIWDAGTTANWWDGLSAAVWPAATSGDDAAVFPAAAGTVTLAGAVAANGLSFTATGYLLDGGSLTLDGSAPTIFTDTGVDAEISSSLAASAGFGKTGDGTLSLSGSVTTGDSIIVSSGTLDFATASSLDFVVTNLGANLLTGPGTVVFRGNFNIDTTAVVTDTGMIWALANVANQSFDSSFAITGFDPDPGGDLWTKPQGSRTWIFSETTGELTLDVPNTPYQDWAQFEITDIEPTADDSPLGDADGDGAANLVEFALNGSPLDGSDQGLLAGWTAAVPTIGEALILTFATREGASFSGNSVTLDGLTYTVLGSADLNDFAAAVSEVTPAIVPPDWPAPAEGYEYHSFRLDGSTGLAGKGFLRLRVETAPVP